MTSFAEANAYLDALGIDAMKSLSPSLHRIEALCDALDHPERATPAIHITGTNGKTSTARIVSSLLAAAGLAVGTFTSPHLQTIRERTTIGREPISENDFADAFAHLLPFVQLVETDLGEKLSYFETLTAMYLVWAADAVDVSVVEVGLGGRWDATNVVPSAVSVITNIGLDHTDLLGSDRESVAKEKAGIIKGESTVVIGERTPALLNLIEAEAEAAKATTSVIEKDFWVGENRTAVGGRYLSLHTSVGDYEDLYLPLHGGHQATNAALALEAASRFSARPFDHELVAEGFGKVEVRGRLETIRLEDETIILDVAHNPDGMSALVSSLIEAFAFDEIVVVFGVLRDKDHLGMLTELRRLPSRVVATEPKSTRALPAADLVIAAEQLGLAAEAVEDPGGALDTARRTGVPLICVTGSHYLVGEARTQLLDAPT